MFLNGIEKVERIKLTLGLLHRSMLLVILSETSNVFLNDGASSLSDLFTPLHFFGELSIKKKNNNNKHCKNAS